MSGEMLVKIVVAVIASGGGIVGAWQVNDRIVAPLETGVKVAAEKADVGNLSLQSLIADRIRTLRREQAAEKDPARKAEIEDKIKAYQDKAKRVDDAILK